MEEFLLLFAVEWSPRMGPSEPGIEKAERDIVELPDDYTAEDIAEMLNERFGYEVEAKDLSVKYNSWGFEVMGHDPEESEEGEYDTPVCLGIKAVKGVA